MAGAVYSRLFSGVLCLLQTQHATPLCLTAQRKNLKPRSYMRAPTEPLYTPKHQPHFPDALQVERDSCKGKSPRKRSSAHGRCDLQLQRAIERCDTPQARARIVGVNLVHWDVAALLRLKHLLQPSDFSCKGRHAFRKKRVAN
jgi:hypothetical protein